MLRRVDPHNGPEYLIRHMFMPHVRDSYEDLHRAAEGADLIVTHPLAFTGPLVAAKRGLPWASTVLSPLSMLSAIDPPLFTPAPWLQTVRKLGVAPYRFVFGFARMIARSWETSLTALRAELALPASGKLAQFEGQYSPALNLALFSPVLATPQADWAPNTVVCGFPRYNGPPPDAQTQAELDAFLAAGDPPIAFALGSSAVMVAGEFWINAIAAALRLKRRAILITGTPPAQYPHAPKTVIAFQYLPYSVVFPRAAVIAHSAGIGTLAQALAAGRPQLVVPLAFDQPDNAQRAVRLGLARTIPFRKATADAMTAELERLCAMPAYAQRANEVGEEVRKENAAHLACDMLERMVPITPASSGLRQA
jgi:UDP:flavonoid glycosyltransferase YjiC (YdhE family)